MKLKVLLPTRVLLEEQVDQVTAEGREGQFCLLAGHVDLVSPLVPGVLAFGRHDENEQYIGIDEGVLVKVGEEVLVSVRQATERGGLADLERRVDEDFRPVDEQEQKARTASSKLEAGLVRRFLDVQEHTPT